MVKVVSATQLIWHLQALNFSRWTFRQLGDDVPSVGRLIFAEFVQAELNQTRFIKVRT